MWRIGKMAFGLMLICQLVTTDASNIEPATFSNLASPASALIAVSWLKNYMKNSNFLEYFDVKCLLCLKCKVSLESTYTSVFDLVTILTGKNFRGNSVQEFIKIESGLLLIDFFDIFTQAIKFYKFCCLILKRSKCTYFQCK